KNNIVSGSTDVRGIAGTVVSKYNDYYGSISGFSKDSTDMNTDPKFVSSTNLRLQSSSPCIDKGADLSVEGGFNYDKDGNFRPQGSGWDIGAYEYGSQQVQTCSQQAGTCCQAGQTCSGTAASASDCSTCCVGTCQAQQQTCSQAGGTCCQTGQTCSGTTKTASDCSTCCVGTCQSQQQTCSQAGGTCCAAGQTCSTTTSATDCATCCVGTCQAQQTCIAGDLNCDKKVDIFDLVIVAQNYGKDSGFDTRADANKDGKVDIFDLVVVAQNYGRNG
ncbi:MAG: choice-of-anchor Q domain-containing protein, partial [Candidatus Woesearchaeota archaeon]